MEAMRVLVLGGGPAGLTAALQAAELGAEVTLVERWRAGGTSLNQGPAPVRTLAWAARLVRDWSSWETFGLRGPRPWTASRRAGRCWSWPLAPGIWTEQLLRHADRVLAVDVAPEALAINRAKHAGRNVDYLVADLFSWTPPRRFDAVCFGFGRRMCWQRAGRVSGRWSTARWRPGAGCGSATTPTLTTRSRTAPRPTATA